MLAEIELDVLHFLDRASLERLKIHSRYLRDVINRQARTLPLRYIHEVTMNDAVCIQMREGHNVEIEVRTPDEGDLEMLSRRLNNTFIHRLEIDFRRESLRLLYQLRANATKLQCQIEALYVGDASHDIDYDIVDFIGVHLKPKVYEAWIDDRLEDYALLFAQNAFRGSVKHFEYELDVFPVPNSIIAGLFGVAVVDTCAIKTEVDPCTWIRKFAETFEAAGRGAEVVRSVTLLHERFEDEPPLRHDIHTLGKPRRTDAPTPHSAFIKNWMQHEKAGVAINESLVAELFVFENAKAAKKLEVFAWTIEEEHEEAENVLHYAFLLQVGDI